MKLYHFLPPTIALLIVIGWSSGEYYSTSKLDKNSAELTVLLTTQSSTALSDPKTSLITPIVTKKPINFENYTEIKKSGSKLAMMQLKQRVQNMAHAELISALDEVDQTEAPGVLMGEHKIMLLTQLCEIDPESALARYFDQLTPGGVTLAETLAGALRKWTQTDSVKAMAWFDTKTGSGTPENAQTLFEGALIKALTTSDPSSAAARLNALPEAKRIKTLFLSSADFIHREGQLEFANFIRTHLPEKDRTPTLAKLVDYSFNGFPSNSIGPAEFVENITQDYERLNDFLTRINATSEERIACIKRSALTQIEWRSYDWEVISLREIEAIRTWVTEQAPSVADEVTGFALAKYMKRNRHVSVTFAQAAEIATKYSDAIASDGPLVEFLNAITYQVQKPEIRIFAESISDPKRRLNVLNQLK